MPYAGEKKNLIMFMLLLSILLSATAHAQNIGFDTNYAITYGNDHVSFLDQGQTIQLSLDQVDGAGFRSKKGYGSGFFHMNIKLPPQHSPAVVTAFYLTSDTSSARADSIGSHDELDFEFLGTEGPSYSLQTNVFSNDDGHREQRLRLWFDPTQDFHKYGLFWNSHQIVFFVDDTPIRVYKNLESLGVNFPKLQKFIAASLWNGGDWASGGKKIYWSKAPFQAQFRGFNIDGCQFGSACDSPKFWWNNDTYWRLTPSQLVAYDNVRKQYLYYDYCGVPGASSKFKECAQQ